MSQLYLLAGAYWQPPRSATCPSSTLQELAGVTAVPVGRSLLAAILCWQVSQLYLLAGVYWQPPRSAICPSSTLQELTSVTAVPVGRSLLAAS